MFSVGFYIVDYGLLGRWFIRYNTVYMDMYDHPLAQYAVISFNVCSMRSSGYIGLRDSSGRTVVPRWTSRGLLLRGWLPLSLFPMSGYRLHGGAD